MKALPVRCLTLIAVLAASGTLVSQDYKKEVAEIAKGMGSRMNFAESDNFAWVLGIQKGQANAIIRAAEKTLATFFSITGEKDRKALFGRKKPLMLVAKSRRQFRRFVEYYAERYKGEYLWAGFANHYKRLRFFGHPSPRVVGAMHLKPADLKGLQNVASHVVGHLCIQRFSFHNRPIPAWLEEGFATYIEARTMKRTNCYCFSGGYGDKAASTDKYTNLKWAKWKQMLASFAKKRSDKHISKILPMQLNELTVAEIGKSWSIIDFLVNKSAKGFANFVKGMKRKWPDSFDPKFNPKHEKAQAGALKEAFDLDWNGLDDAWRKYVTQSYR